MSTINNQSAAAAAAAAADETSQPSSAAPVSARIAAVAANTSNVFASTTGIGSSATPVIYTPTKSMPNAEDVHAGARADVASKSAGWVRSGVPRSLPARAAPVSHSQISSGAAAAAAAASSASTSTPVETLSRPRASAFSTSTSPSSRAESPNPLTAASGASLQVIPPKKKLFGVLPLFAKKPAAASSSYKPIEFAGRTEEKAVLNKICQSYHDRRVSKTPIQDSRLVEALRLCGRKKFDLSQAPGKLGDRALSKMAKELNMSVSDVKCMIIGEAWTSLTANKKAKNPTVTDLVNEIRKRAPGESFDEAKLTSWLTSISDEEKVNAALSNVQGQGGVQGQIQEQEFGALIGLLKAHGECLCRPSHFLQLANLFENCNLEQREALEPIMQATAKRLDVSQLRPDSEFMQCIMGKNESTQFLEILFRTSKPATEVGPHRILLSQVDRLKGIKEWTTADLMLLANVSPQELETIQRTQSLAGTSLEGLKSETVKSLFEKQYADSSYSVEERLQLAKTKLANVVARQTEWISLLEQGKPVLIPHYFHATKPENYIGILTSEIEVRGGISTSPGTPSYRGAFASTAPELGYGSVVFGLPEEIHFEAKGLVSKSDERSVWIGANRPVAINQLARAYKNQVVNSLAAQFEQTIDSQGGQVSMEQREALKQGLRRGLERRVEMRLNEQNGQMEPIWLDPLLLDRGRLEANQRQQHSIATPSELQNAVALFLLETSGYFSAFPELTALLSQIVNQTESLIMSAMREFTNTQGDGSPRFGIRLESEKNVPQCIMASDSDRLLQSRYEVASGDGYVRGRCPTIDTIKNDCLSKGLVHPDSQFIPLFEMEIHLSYDARLGITYPAAGHRTPFDR